MLQPHLRRPLGEGSPSINSEPPGGKGAAPSPQNPLRGRVLQRHLRTPWGKSITSEPPERKSTAASPQNPLEGRAPRHHLKTPWGEVCRVSSQTPWGKGAPASPQNPPGGRAPHHLRTPWWKRAWYHLREPEVEVLDASVEVLLLVGFFQLLALLSRLLHQELPLVS